VAHIDFGNVRFPVVVFLEIHREESVTCSSGMFKRWFMARIASSTSAGSFSNLPNEVFPVIPEGATLAIM
jgi:hypothetical protein